MNKSDSRRHLVPGDTYTLQFSGGSLSKGLEMVISGGGDERKFVTTLHNFPEAYPGHIQNHEKCELYIIFRKVVI